MATVEKLQRYWQKWESKLDPLVRSKGAKLIFPSVLRSLGGTKESLIVAPETPVCIYNAPPKASSRLGRTAKQAIFISGKFEVALEEDVAPPLLHAACNVTIFRYLDNGDTISLDLLDAIHFDVERPFALEDGKGCKHFHPIFHAQRGESLSDAVCQQVLAEELHLEPASIIIEQRNKSVLGTPYLRLPTPQLDVFSVMTMVAADYFCNPGDAERDEMIEKTAKEGGRPRSHDRTNVTERFIALLDLLRQPGNLAREGESSAALRGRLTAADHISAAHWYPECA